jgi:hypothetical protein
MFKSYSIQGIKQLDYQDFLKKKIGVLIAKKKHLTPKGLDLILLIKHKMNTIRITY